MTGVREICEEIEDTSLPTMCKCSQMYLLPLQHLLLHHSLLHKTTQRNARYGSSEHSIHTLDCGHNMFVRKPCHCSCSKPLKVLSCFLRIFYSWLKEIFHKSLPSLILHNVTDYLSKFHYVALGTSFKLSRHRFYCIHNCPFSQYT